MQNNTIVAIATAPGHGAIAVLRLSGPDAIVVADAVFKGKNLTKQATHTAHFGYIIDGNGQILDEVLATVFHGPKSYTGENTVEFSLHGSPFIQQQVLELLLDHGVSLAKPGEFTMRAYLNGKMDLTQAEAVADLIASENAAAHQVAMHQLRGGFKAEIETLRSELIHFASLVELELDFSEEDVEFADRGKLLELVKRIQGYIDHLLQSFSLGNVIKNGVLAVIAGRPNAGKSTLLNALLNEERAIVSEIAGTTRDTIEENLNIKGVQFRLTDTAGIREAQDAIEAIGVQRTMEKMEQAAIVVYVWDVSSGMKLNEVHSDIKTLILEKNREGKKPQVLVVCNKMDRNPYFLTDWLVQPEQYQDSIHEYLLDEHTKNENLSGLRSDQVLALSAKNGQNIAYLKEKMLELATGTELNLESTVVTNVRHFEALKKANQALSDVKTGLETGITGDFVAQDIRHSLTYLGEITGQIGVEDLLENIFSKFCIGK